MSTDGHLNWARALGNETEDRGVSLVKTNDGGFAIGGSTDTQHEIVMVKFDPAYNVSWCKTAYLEGNPNVELWSVCQITTGELVGGGFGWMVSGDALKLGVKCQGDDSDTDADLCVVLDVFGQYWFWPGSLEA